MDNGSTDVKESKHSDLPKTIEHLWFMLVTVLILFGNILHHLNTMLFYVFF